MEGIVRLAAGRWDGLGSRDANSREAAMENIRQDVMSRAEKIGPVCGVPRTPGSPARSPDDLNDMLARLLMLSRRCPHADVRERSDCVLRSVQYQSSHSRALLRLGAEINGGAAGRQPEDRKVIRVLSVC
uniref:Uncharacterized protein n=1 Tax=Lepisosteus oculatus TaxID=7918 RepID=W5NIQ8_LEPOC